MNAFAHVGKVEMELDEIGFSLTRVEAAELIVKLASALQMSGDMCDPATVFLHEQALSTLKSIKEEHDVT